MATQLLLDFIEKESNGKLVICIALISELSATQYVPDKAFPIFENNFKGGQIKVCWWLEGLDKNGMQFLGLLRNESRKHWPTAPDWAIDLGARDILVARVLSRYGSEFLTEAHLSSIVPRPHYSCEHFYKTGPSYPRLIS